MGSNWGGKARFFADGITKDSVLHSMATRQDTNGELERISLFFQALRPDILIVHSLGGRAHAYETSAYTLHTYSHTYVNSKAIPN